MAPGAGCVGNRPSDSWPGKLIKDLICCFFRPNEIIFKSDDESFPALNGQIEDLRRTAAQLIEDGHSERALALLLELLTRLAADNERLQLRLGALLRDKFGRKTEKSPRPN